jgi:hypothetical protein
MKKIEITILEDIGIIEKKPSYPENAYYQIQKIAFNGKEFYRRQKVSNGKVTSSSYAYEPDASRWKSGLWEM